MKEKLEKLVRILNEVQPEWIEESMSEDGEFDFFVRWPSEVYTDALESLCCELFIGRNGTPNYTMINEFNKTCDGFTVGPGETDGFGWLTGAITTDGGLTLAYCFG